MAALATALVWSANLFEIISLASRAFALYYLLQTLLAWQISSKVAGCGGWRCKTGFLMVCVLLALVVVFGKVVG